MRKQVITRNVLAALKPQDKPYFLRDKALNGFAVKINPSGKVSWISEVRYNGQLYRKTMGEYPLVDVEDARYQALEYMAQIKSGKVVQPRKLSVSLLELFESYIAVGRLKHRTTSDYKEAVSFYLSDWLGLSVSDISRAMVEKRFVQIRNKGINGGKPTYSQATKTMRILSALMNYAMADDLIDINPVIVLKQKRIDRSSKKREHYLPTHKVRELL